MKSYASVNDFYTVSVIESIASLNKKKISRSSRARALRVPYLLSTIKANYSQQYFAGNRVSFQEGGVMPGDRCWYELRAIS